MADRENGTALTLDFTKLAQAAASGDVIPVAVQHADTREVILVAYTNASAFRESMARRTLVLWSTSRHERWEKGATSGQTFELVDAYVNCEQNALLYLVRPRAGGICHTRNARGRPRHCFYRRIDMDTLALENIDP